MSFKKTKLFSETGDDKSSDVQKSEEEKRPAEEEYADSGVEVKDIEDLDYLRVDENKLYFDRVGKKFARNVESRLVSMSNGQISNWEEASDNVKEIYIEEYTGDFNSLLDMLSKFTSLRYVKIESMLSVDVAILHENYKDSYTIEIEECSLLKLDIGERNRLPKIKIKKSLCDEIGIFRSISIVTGMEEWFEEVTNIGSTEYTEQVEFVLDKRFNKVYLFNQLFGTKLRSLRSVECDIECTTSSGDFDVEDILHTTRFGSYFTEKAFLIITMELKHGDFNSGKLEVNHYFSEGDSDE